MTDATWGPSPFRYKYVQDWLRKGAKEMQDYEKSEAERLLEREEAANALLNAAGTFACMDPTWLMQMTNVEDRRFPQEIHRIKVALHRTDRQIHTASNLVAEDLPSIDPSALWQWVSYDSDADVFQVCACLTDLATQLQADFGDPGAAYTRAAAVLNAWGMLSSFASMYEIDLPTPLPYTKAHL